MAVCVAVIGKDNNPLYIRCAKPEQVDQEILVCVLVLTSIMLLAGVESPLHCPHQPGRGGGEAGQLRHRRQGGARRHQGALPGQPPRVRASEGDHSDALFTIKSDQSEALFTASDQSGALLFKVSDQ